MKAFIYLLQVSACSGIFYSFYFLFLRRLTFFTLNRWYLLGTLILSFVIPTLSFEVDTVQPSPIMQPVMYVQQMQALPVEAPVATETNAVESPFNWIGALYWAYVAIAVVSVIHFALALFNFYRRLHGQNLMQIGQVRVLKADKKQGNSSFLNVIFVNDDELEPAEVQQIIAHELLHIKLLHSADRLLARLAQVALWFNPFVYLYMRSIEENHEFEVDRLAAKDDEKGMYAQLLFKLAVSGRGYLFHSFSKVPLKKRLAMLFNKPTSNMKRIIYLLALPMVVLSCLAFANLKDGQDKKVSAITGLEQLGPHPLVLINGKQYNDDILYKISNKCVNGTGIYRPTVTSKQYQKYGNKVKDGVVEIRVLGKITYMTPLEHENLVLEAAVPKSQFYARIKQKTADGKLLDKIIINIPKGGAMSSSEIKPTDKAVFIVEGKAYPEADVNKVEEILKSKKASSWSVGSVNANQHWGTEDISSYNVYFNILLADDNSTGKGNISGAINSDGADTLKYRQKLKETKEQKKDREKGRQKFAEFLKSDEYKQKQEAIAAVKGKVSAFKVLGIVDTNAVFSGKFTAVRVQHGNYQYLVGSKLLNDDILNSKLQPGDEIEIKVKTILFFRGGPLIIQPETVSKGGVELFRAPAEPAPNYAFLYEANKVRFADGKLSSVEKYANGKWKSAVILAPNGSKIKVNIKPSAPAFENIAIGEEVRFRFVHEVKTGNDYVVNDWVSLTKGYMGYGTINPEYFYKFYEKV
ncbi:M56 family metallopeptidase [Mucilaginibacter pedocola]|uniref:Peptidase M56 domain-containing protein n=1 Tax=Mucilaginibacter pedocola TaxID=1792845 RepID=A0A1S9PEX3_9SPHI|nr:M56 family metallopeptidase [Mucilaginibacter pedocola]OOQ59449.1 hypothetical protein BC343_04510 [Mucilaginibacter pedocola]